jgi:hypothetical protein
MISGCRKSIRKNLGVCHSSAYPMYTIDELSRSMCAAKKQLSGPKHLGMRRSDLLPPVGTILSVDGKLVREARSSRDGTLSDTSRSVHPGSALLVDAVPVNGRTEAHVVLDVDDDGVTIVSLNHRTRVLSYIGSEC